MSINHKTRKYWAKHTKEWVTFALNYPEDFNTVVCDLLEMSGDLEKAKRRNKLFTDCLHRAQRLYSERHPEADGIMDGAENIAWVLEQIKVLEEQKKEGEK